MDGMGKPFLLPCQTVLDDMDVASLRALRAGFLQAIRLQSLQLQLQDIDLNGCFQK